MIAAGIVCFHPAHGAERAINPGECVKAGRDRVCAPKCQSAPKPAPCPPAKPCPTEKPCPPVSTPAPVPQPAPVPPPVPEPVSCHKTVTPSAMQHAHDASKGGETYCVTDGTRTSGLIITKPITFLAAPGARPKINPGMDPEGQIQIYADDVTFDGFEVFGGYIGFHFYGDNLTLRNNYAHHSKLGNFIGATYQRPITKQVIENNISEWGGYDLAGKSIEGVSPKNVHAFYWADYACEGITGLEVRNNVARHTTGRAMLFNGLSGGSGSPCETKMTGNSIVENIGEGVSWGLAGYYNFDNNIVRHNSFSMTGYPPTQDQDHPCFALYSSVRNTIVSNECVTPWKGNMDAGAVQDFGGSRDNTVTNNTMK